VKNFVAKPQPLTPQPPNPPDGGLKKKISPKVPQKRFNPPNPPNGGLKKKISPKVPQMGDLGG